MEKPFIELDPDGILIHPFTIPEPEGIKFPENYPNCCENHKKWFSELVVYIVKFPKCCDGHEKFFANFKFDKTVVYKDFPMEILNKAFYTQYIIATKIDNEDWYEDIKDYIDFCTTSMGTPSIGWNHYKNMVLSYIDNWKEQIPKDKKTQIVNYLNEKFTYKPSTEKASLNKLYTVYERWLKIFPFDLPFFKPLEAHLSKSLPFIKGKPKVNRYSGIALAKMVTESELVEALYVRTKQILSIIDTTQLVKDGHLTELEKINIDIINENHRLKQKALTADFNKGERKYIKAIKQWFANEKDYFDEIKPKLKQLPAAKPKKEKTPKNYFGFSGDTNALLTVLKALQLRVDMLKEDFTTVDNFHKLLTAKDFSNLDVKVHLNCDNKQFYYIITKLQPYFTNLKWVTIAKSMLFLSEGNSLLGQSDLSSAKNNNPKLKTVIDNIFRDMK